jgi:hypothetical protein
MKIRTDSVEHFCEYKSYYACALLPSLSLPGHLMTYELQVTLSEKTAFM